MLVRNDKNGQLPKAGYNWPVLLSGTVGDVS